MATVVISQPMLFPWIGLFEQISLSDYFIFYDDVQYSKGSFTNRVQLKSQIGSDWMTIPLERFRLGERISEISISGKEDWRGKHRNLLCKNYSSAPYYKDMLDIVDSVYDKDTNNLSELVSSSMIAICEYYSLYSGAKYYWSSGLQVDGASSERVLKIVKKFNGDVYVTGHGAKNYLDHILFEENRVRVEYMNYELREYKQLHGQFNPHVSILDLIANCGKEGKVYIAPNTIFWKDFIHE